MKKLILYFFIISSSLMGEILRYPNSDFEKIEEHLTRLQFAPRISSYKKKHTKFYVKILYDYGIFKCFIFDSPREAYIIESKYFNFNNAKSIQWYYIDFEAMQKKFNANEKTQKERLSKIN